MQGSAVLSYFIFYTSWRILFIGLVIGKRAMATKPKLLLIGESFSPWTKKARWAMEYCDLDYNYQEFTPTLSEPGLRWRLKQIKGSVSVPVLFTEQQVIKDSWNIACYANEKAGDNRLGNMDELSSWNDLSEDALAQGRTRVLRSIVNNNDALEESLPSFVPKLLRGPMRFMARDTVKRLDRQYAHLLKADSLVKALDSTREALAKSGNDYITGNFSYADITMATVLEVIHPIAKVEPPLGPETQKTWIDPSLAEEYADLIEWRDRLAANQTTSYSQFK